MAALVKQQDISLQNSFGSKGVNPNQIHRTIVHPGSSFDTKTPRDQHRRKNLSYNFIKLKNAVKTDRQNDSMNVQRD